MLCRRPRRKELSNNAERVKEATPERQRKTDAYSAPSRPLQLPPTATTTASPPLPSLSKPIQERKETPPAAAFPPPSLSLSLGSSGRPSEPGGRQGRQAGKGKEAEKVAQRRFLILFLSSHPSSSRYKRTPSIAAAFLRVSAAEVVTSVAKGGENRGPIRPVRAVLVKCTNMLSPYGMMAG